ncbi:hypothetical protein [Phycicoccus sonneratiae]|uniref:Sensor histidine kinase n=1 Tax=Phycicoccus sonneratiae TaxID=2807628 RepID=A0ABS2CKP8_9MICO|nr:hypothetical protein [Phycicoccus sonneraticus]MBM6400456.1 hypothetical protein [Phycicoccus sonneraticus]
MVAVVLSLLLITALAVAVVGVVAVPARRAGRRVLTRRGHATLETLRERVAPGSDAAAPVEVPERERLSA